MRYQHNAHRLLEVCSGPFGPRIQDIVITHFTMLPLCLQLCHLKWAWSQKVEIFYDIKKVYCDNLNFSVKFLMKNSSVLFAPFPISHCLDMMKQSYGFTRMVAYTYLQVSTEEKTSSIKFTSHIWWLVFGPVLDFFWAQLPEFRTFLNYSTHTVHEYVL